MNVRAVFGLSALFSLISCGIVAGLYCRRPLRALPRHRALRVLAAPHAFRFVGLSFLVPGVVSPSLPSEFSVPAAYGDLSAMVLAWAAIVALTRRWSVSMALVWALHLWGVVDFVYAIYQGVTHINPSMLGAAFFIPTALVPPLLIDHLLSFELLVKGPQ
jgi:hypothetical protein